VTVDEADGTGREKFITLSQSTLAYTRPRTSVPIGYGSCVPAFSNSYNFYNPPAFNGKPRQHIA